jgi:hypothetical protein
LIASQEKESLILEYKACDALAQNDDKKNELSKDVSAFANSAGGTIIYGIVEGSNVPTKLDIGFDRKKISKEWLEQVINSRIQRRIDGVVINQVELTTGSVAYVVVIPQSTRAPHQAHDKRFYKRFNFVSVPMEEYEVRDTSRRSEAPDLSIRFLAEVSGSTEVPNQEPSSHFVSIHVVITNDSPTPAKYIVINIFLDNRLTISGRLSDLSKVGTKTLQCQGQSYECTQLQMNHSVPGKIPIFQGTDFSLLGKPLRVSVDKPNKYVVTCELIAPGMPKRIFEAILDWDGKNPSLTHL